MTKIPFNRASAVGHELTYIAQAIESGQLSGDGAFTHKCHDWLEAQMGCPGLLTHSCTGALEMACILADLQPGDEVILPSYTFVSTANAIALRHAVPVFVDIRPDTLNIDETKIEAAITDRTKAIMVVHYAGVCAEMDAINEIASRYGLFVIEDAAQAFLSRYKGRLAGTLSDCSAFSFHETKNLLSGEGGALLLPNKELVERAEIIREKGTDRKRFFRGQVDKYTWCDIGSSYLPSELVAAFLFAQFEQSADVTDYRRRVFDRYYEAFDAVAEEYDITLPVIPDHCEANGHLFYLCLPTPEARGAFIQSMNEAGITTPFHYVPLHSAKAGRALGRAHGDMSITDDISARLVRLPIFYGVGDNQDGIIGAAMSALEKLAQARECPS